MRILFQITLLLFCVYSNAQEAFTNSGNLQIHTGASITGFGNFTNNSSGALTNNGSFYIKGNLSNDQASMTVGSGTLYLNGSSAQSVNGAQTFKTSDLVTNNSAGITINNNLSVSGTHTFTAGLITTSSTPNYLLYEAGSSYSGDNDSKHVNGWVKKYGATDFIFPVGDATYERTSGISNLSASSEFNCKYYTATSNINNLNSPLIQVDPNEYWQIDKVSGGTAKIGLNWDHSKVAFPNFVLAYIVVAHYTAGNWTSEGGSATGNITTTGNITSDAVNSFSPFTFASTSFLLPLKIVSLAGERKSGTTFLNWVTENEQNVSHFEIQRSDNAVNFKTIGTVAARNIILRQHYNFEDHATIQGIAYYRLKSVDYDGKISYSNIVAVTDNEFQSSSFFVLNPVRNAITVFNKTGQEGLYNYRLFNASGQLIVNGEIKMSVNGGAMLPLPALTAAGVYTLELSNEKILFRKKLLVEK